MHDFRKLVAPRRKRDPREGEIVSELACHLEEIYIHLRGGGASEEHALAVVSTAGKDLGSTVRRLRWQREGGLRTWLRAMALPGLIMSLLRSLQHWAGCLFLGISNALACSESGFGQCRARILRFGILAGTGRQGGASAVGRVCCDLVPGCCGVRHDFPCNSLGIG